MDILPPLNFKDALESTFNLSNLTNVFNSFYDLISKQNNEINILKNKLNLLHDAQVQSNIKYDEIDNKNNILSVDVNELKNNNNISMLNDINLFSVSSNAPQLIKHRKLFNANDILKRASTPQGRFSTSSRQIFMEPIIEEEG